MMVRFRLQRFDEVIKYFDSHQDINVVYGDEDIWYLPEGEDAEPDNELKHRMAPWVKPCGRRIRCLLPVFW